MTLRAGVIGWPVGHSLSPQLHGHWLRRYGIDGSYAAIPVAPGQLEEELRRLVDEGYAGVNLTVPHKQAALALCDTIDAAARSIGAANTLVFRAGGIHGSNSDAFGFLENLKQAQPELRPEAGAAVVLGAGGAARAVVWALLDRGAPEVRLVNRTLARAEALAADLGGAIRPVAWSGLADALATAALLVNTTSLGMTGQPPLEIDLAPLPREALVTDIVYAPLETALLAAARARGNPAVDGLGMLLHQARPGFEAWFGIAPEVTPELRAAVLGDAG
ncbi:MAG: shikimate dehydrogenase [Rhodovibrionaceae bacterium]